MERLSKVSGFTSYDHVQSDVLEAKDKALWL